MYFLCIYNIGIDLKKTTNMIVENDTTKQH